MYRLPDEHLEKVRDFAVNNRKKKKCRICYDRGYIGITEENLLFPCVKCVDMEKVEELWKDYVKSVPELFEHFKELFEEDKEKEDNEDKS
jgi:hypothetical protein